MDLLIKNGTIVTTEKSFKADLLIDKGKIVNIGEDLKEQANQVIEASGKLVLPGAIDVNTHLSMPSGGAISADGYLAGTRAAACGGVTTLFDTAIQRKGRGIIETVLQRKKMCEKEACVDYAFHCGITDLNKGTLLKEIEAAVQWGITSFNCFLTYKIEGMQIDDASFLKVLVQAKKVGALISVHAENSALIEKNVAQFIKEGRTSAWYHYLSRPEKVETEAVKRALHWARTVRSPLYLAHISAKESLEAALVAKKEGMSVFIETCPQYLAYTCEVYKREDARRFVCSPTIKDENSQKALWKGIQEGGIDVMATNHCPFQSYEKDWGKEDFTKIPNGLSGVEILYPYMLDAANKGRISFNRVVAMCATNPARIFGCINKGSIEIGKDADLVIYNPKEYFEVKADNMHSDSDHTIWEGTTFKGYPEQTYVRGKLVFDKGNFIGKPGDGKFIERKIK